MPATSGVCNYSGMSRLREASKTKLWTNYLRGEGLLRNLYDVAEAEWHQRMVVTSLCYDILSALDWCR